MNRYSKLLFPLICAALCCGCGSQNNQPQKETEILSEESPDRDDDNWEEAKNTPYGRYPQEVKYTLGQMSTTTNSNLPDGNSYEDNAYTRYLKQMLNIQNESVYIEQQDRYDDYISIIVKDRTLPDVLVISDRETLLELVDDNLLEDLTAAYENCTTPRIKAMYDSYGKELLEAGTFDGKLLAIPETVIDHGPCLLWLRKDWMDQLNLKEPKNLDEAVSVIEAFVQNRMGTEEGETPVGLACDTSLVGTTSSSFSVDPIFDSFGACPQKWVEQDGKVVYGSLTEETRQALNYLHELYEKGILDPDFALRTQNNIRDLVIEGKCGAFFGLWWTPNNPLMDALEKNPNAVWKPYYFGIDRPEHMYESFRDNKYVVVRKGYEHPEIVMKIISVLFDYTRYDAEDADEVNGYFALNVEPSARPLVINVDYNEAAFQVTEDLRMALNGEKDLSEISCIARAYFDSCQSYLNSSNYTTNDWSSFESRMDAVGLLIDKGYVTSERNYLKNKDGRISRSLQTLEKNSFIQMIMGEKSMDYFDEFKENWYHQGGKELTEMICKDEINE